MGAQRQERLACRKEYVQVKRLDACFVFFASAVGKTVQGAYLELNIQPHTYNTKDFSPEKDPFVEETLKTGIEIEV